MDRLTRQIGDDWCVPYERQQEAADLLAAYEDTGLTPEEIQKLQEGYQAQYESLKNIMAATQGRLTVERLQELAAAEVEGCLVVLPCKVGDTVYYLTGAPLHRNILNFNRVEESVCKGMLIERDGVQIRLNYDWKGNHGTYGYFGKTVFLTREEAEAALAKEGR